MVSFSLNRPIVLWRPSNVEIETLGWAIVEYPSGTGTRSNRITARRR